MLVAVVVEGVDPRRRLGRLAADLGGGDDGPQPRGDPLLVAAGELSGADAFEKLVKMDHGFVVTDDTGQTSDDHIFAGGDVVTGAFGFDAGGGNLAAIFETTTDDD